MLLATASAIPACLYHRNTPIYQDSTPFYIQIEDDYRSQEWTFDCQYGVGWSQKLSLQLSAWKQPK